MCVCVCVERLPVGRTLLTHHTTRLFARSSYGDGFPDATISVTGPGGFSKSFPGILGSAGVEVLCDMDTDGCYTVDVTACDWEYETTWTLGEGNDVEGG